MSSNSQLSYGTRAGSHPNALVRRLFGIAETKRTNVTVSADVTTTKELLELADCKKDAKRNKIERPSIENEKKKKKKKNMEWNRLEY